MFSTEQPAHMREEETSCSVVRIGIGLAIFMMNPVVSGPVDRGILERHSVQNHKQQLERPLGFVGSVRPKSVSPGCDSQAATLIH